eukprot:TRINITY_DN12102_c0_g2_i3.p1 TRINITY_DN12102_c0_g2~~TRINITY_DN12102_c0_g2_i3.p1  ORF type:complete len:511 (+),score=130.26 TRINITY_DN12102_c0_g2_i3:187-1719(+)
MDVTLDTTELEALKNLRELAQSEDGDDLLIRCLMARKFDVRRAHKLLISYKNNLLPMIGSETIRSEQVREQISAGELLLPGTFDKNDAAIIVYNAAKHREKGYSPQETLQTILYLVDIALQDERAMRNGITIVSFLRGLSWAKLDNGTHKLLLKTLQNNYPARINRVAVISPGWTTKAALRIMRPFMKNKLSAKLKTYPSIASLSGFVDATALPASVGGELQFDHEAWLDEFLAPDNVVSTLSPIRSRLPSTSHKKGKLERKAAKLASPNFDDASEIDFAMRPVCLTPTSAQGVSQEPSPARSAAVESAGAGDMSKNAVTVEQNAAQVVERLHELGALVSQALDMTVPEIVEAETVDLDQSAVAEMAVLPVVSVEDVLAETQDIITVIPAVQPVCIPVPDSDDVPSHMEGAGSHTYTLEVVDKVDNHDNENSGENAPMKLTKSQKKNRRRRAKLKKQKAERVSHLVPAKQQCSLMLTNHLESSSSASFASNQLTFLGPLNRKFSVQAPCI